MGTVVAGAAIWGAGVLLHVPDLLLDACLLLGLLAWLVPVASRSGRLQEQLARNQEYLHQLVRQADQIVTVVDDQAIVRWQSASVHRLLGHPEGVALGRSLFDLVHEEDRELVGLVFAEAVEDNRPDGGVLRVSARVQDAAGRWRDTESTISDLRRVPAVQGIVIHTTDTTDQRTLQRQLERMSFADYLTGLGNRSMLFDRLERALAFETPLTVVVLDLDGFRSVNDLHGQDVGDALLVEVGNRLAADLRASDTVARTDADAFAVVLDGHQPDAPHVAERLLHALSAPYAVAQGTFEITASVGIAFADGTEDAATVVRNADLALRQAKAAGRGRIEVYEPRLHEDVLSAITFERDLRASLDAGELGLVYQPIVSMAGRNVISVETLLRWDHPVRGQVSPEEFIPVAEESGLIVRIGRWVLEQACLQGANWLAAGFDLSVGVNVSVRQVQSRRLVADVRRALELSALPPQRLILEITESALLGETDRTVEDLRKLHQMGCRIALDDFGKGYSSLSYLRRLPVDILKIDREFVSGVPGDPVRTALTEAVIALGRRLGIAVVVEGVESEAQYAGLAAMGATFGQGYLFSGPLPAAAANPADTGNPADTSVSADPAAHAVTAGASAGADLDALLARELLVPHGGTAVSRN